MFEISSLASEVSSPIESWVHPFPTLVLKDRDWETINEKMSDYLDWSLTIHRYFLEASIMIEKLWEADEKISVEKKFRIMYIAIWLSLHNHDWRYLIYEIDLIL